VLSAVLLQIKFPSPVNVTDPPEASALNCPSALKVPVPIERTPQGPVVIPLAAI